MNLKKRIEKDHRSILELSNALFQIYAKDIGAFITEANKEVLSMIAAILSRHQDLNYRSLQISQTFEQLQSMIDHRYLIAANNIEQYWSVKRDNFDLLSRIASSFIARKASPPWRTVKLNLKDDVATDGKFSPGTGYIRFYFKNMSADIIKQIQRGVLQEETLNQILSRVRKMFNRREKQGVREARTILKRDPNKDKKLNLTGTVDIQEGIYTLEDVEQFQEDQRRAMQWSYRETKPWFTDSVKANNKWLRDLEQLLMNDAVNLMHEGNLKIGTDEMGIEDFVWVVTRPGVCECCDKRSGLTMAEIKDKIDDEYGDDPPPLHNFCRCQLAPKLKDDWADKELKKEGMEWDQETGTVYNADEQEVELGIKDMTLNEYLNNIASSYE